MCSICSAGDQTERSAHFLRDFSSGVALAEHLRNSFEDVPVKGKGLTFDQWVTRVRDWYEKKSASAREVRRVAEDAEVQHRRKMEALLAQATDPEDAVALVRMAGFSEQFVRAVEATAKLWRKAIDTGRFERSGLTTLAKDVPRGGG